MDKQMHIVEFSRYLTIIQGKAQRTKEEYEYEISLFLRYLRLKKEKKSLKEIDDINIYDINIDFLKKINLEDIYSFLEYCKIGRKNSSYAIARKIAALKSFFNYLTEKKKYFKENPTDELDTPKTGKRNPVFLNIGEVKQLYSGINKLHYYRDYCILTIFLNCGVRLSELQSINLDFIKGDKFSVIGKGNKERVIYMNKSCLKAINDYIKIERPNTKNADTEKALFLSQKGNRMSAGAIQKMIRKLNKKSGLLKKDLSPHKLRHTMATLLYQNGADLISLQQILGHSSVATTQIYTHISSEKLKKVVENNPLNK
jgi:site-specific recombinase XerD